MREKELLLLLVTCVVNVSLVSGSGHNHGPSSRQKQPRVKLAPLLKARCDLNCLDVAKPNRTECRQACKESITKPGSCPTSIQGTEDIWATACVEACSSDVHCDATAKCCNIGCSASCLEPTDLLDLPGLPAIPVVSNVTEKKHAIVVRWVDAVGDTARGVPGDTLYVLEEQHHLGPKYEEKRLGEWNPIVRSAKKQASLKGILKPGRWYRFRVAAVGTAGTRGYSKPSTPFRLRRGPRPPGPPRRPRITRLRAHNGNITAVLEWRAAKSELPVSKYKVFWSRRVRGIDGALDSVLVNHQVVPQEQTYAEIPNLQPNSMYFLQVQSIAPFGLTKLRSEKAATFFNTTNYENDTETLIKDSKRNQKHKITGLKLEKVIWHNSKLKARVSWNALPEFNGRPRSYMIQWWTGVCEGDNKDYESRKELAATTLEHVFELYELSYGCQYRVFLNRLPSKNSEPPEAMIKFAVPSCRYFQERTNATHLCEGY